MKNYLFAALSFLFITACGQSEGYKSSVKLVIDRNTSESDLTKLIQGAEMVNVRLGIDEKDYDEKGNLLKIRGRVEVPNAGSGTFASDNLGKIVISQEVDSDQGGLSIVVKNRIF